METQMIPSRFIRQPENIPEEIVLDILSRLPVKSLLRFRCVCKVWKSLISDPKFTLSSPSHKIAIKIGNLYSIDTGHGLSRTISLPRDPLLKQMLFYDDENASKRLNILGSCNGLFLVSHYEDFYLWNPSTWESTKVLSYRVTGLPKDFFFSVYPSGLCYDSSADDYKAVMVMDFGKAYVVSFKRKYRTTATFHTGDNANKQISLSGPVVNEKLHWAITSLGRDFPTGSRIVSFNPLIDEFEEFPMPFLVNNGEREAIIKGLGVLDGCLCMTRCVSVSGGDEVGPGFFELLVMKEYGVAGSWTRILKVSKDFMVLAHEDLVPLCFTSDGEVVISSTHLNKLCAYDLADMSQRDIIIPSKCLITYQTSYVESLVSPAAYAHEEDWIVESGDEWRSRRP